MIIDLMCHRFTFMQMFSKGVVLDIGCADAAQWRYPMIGDSITKPPNIKNIILIDCDEWKNNLGLKFIRAYAENIPLPDLYANTCIYGDILEHCYDPNVLLTEGKRLAKDRIIISVPLEYEWDLNNPNIKAFETREKHLKDGKNLRELGFDQTIRHPSGMCIDAVDDTIFEHIHHKRFYTEETFKQLLHDNFDDSWEYYIFKLKYSQFNFVNLAAVAVRKDMIKT